MKLVKSLSLLSTLLVLGPMSANAENLNWTVWPGNKTVADKQSIDQLQETEHPNDALVEAGLDDSPAAPLEIQEDEYQSDPYLVSEDLLVSSDDVVISPHDVVISTDNVVINPADEGMLAKYEIPGEPEPETIVSASKVMPEYTTSGQAIVEPSIAPASIVELASDELAEEADASTIINADTLEIDEAAAITAADKVSSELQTTDAVVVEEVVVEDTSVTANEIMPVQEIASSSDVVAEETVVVDDADFSVVHDSATNKSVDPASAEESAEDAALAAIEAEVNDSLVLGPVAISDDLADAADGADAVAEDASGSSSSKITDTPSDNPGRYDEVMSEIIKADQINEDNKPANTDIPAPLPLEQVLELALTNNPEVGMALAREEQARWVVREAGSYRSPTVDMVVEFGPERNRPATKSSDIDDITPGRNLNLRISKLLYDGGVSVAEENRRMQIRRTTEIETRLVIEEVVTKAIKSYMEILQNQQSARVAEEFVAEMQRMVNQISQMHESGAASKIELDFAKSRLASARAQTGNSAAQLNDALSSLEFLTGDLAEFIAVAPIDVSTVAVDTLLNYMESARNNNAEVLLNASNKTALSLKIRSQQAGYSPILSLNFKTEALQDEGGNSEAHVTSEVKLKAEYFLIDGGVRKARIQRSKAQLMELQWDHERLVKDIDRRIKQSYNQITTNRLTLAATEDEIKSNQELRRLNRQNLEMGDISILELIEVEERLFNSQATWHRISSEMLRNYYDLLIGVGDLPAVLVQDYTSSRIAE